MLPWHSLWWHLLGKADLGHSLLPSGSSSSSVPPLCHKWLSCPSRACNRCQCQEARQLKAPGPGHPGTTPDSCTRVIHQEGTLLRLFKSTHFSLNSECHIVSTNGKVSTPCMEVTQTVATKTSPTKAIHSLLLPVVCPGQLRGQTQPSLCHRSRELSAARLPQVKLLSYCQRGGGWKQG